MTDLGMLYFFLGIEVKQTSTGIFLPQQKYIQQLLEKAKMADCKTVSTPIVPSDVKSEISTEYCDVSFYKMLVGSLQYLTITRPDIAFAVNSVCQDMQKPTVVHYQMVKRILRCLKGTIDIGHCWD